ncbi:fungal-specific transcription factor domain-containing protein [Lipomyces tetrasporus]|uniref:Fungal-specific transcription factor domain-containing protein n=1 Tax=Lipomyces tetrasporus TaxID=54092 RepID=A0AAD7VSG6_9ASCO|nr:fungal-specific transcription factor domain-containing protein [Lipomyces tetrasporus]KAJ8100313.1 fungal-specific transcription factor domain-containing protein [Lipomyces tetrasporus]
MSSRRPVSPIPEYPRLRTRRACQICRRRKVKCDGITPSCGQCSLRGAMCYYKDDDKSTDSHGSVGSNQSSPIADNNKRRKVESPALQASPATQPSPIHNTVYSGITANNAGVESFIYYGPASTFSFIQHIHQEINAGIIEMTGVGDVPEGIKKYGFRDLFLGWNVERNPDAGSSAGTVKFLDPSTAAKFLDNFWKTIGYIMPVYSKSDLQSVLDSMYSSKTPSFNSEAGLLCVLATGASLDGENDWSNLLYDRAIEIVKSASEIISTDRVKVLLLLSHHQAMSGNMNMAYNLSGQGVRLAYACGLHREFPSLSQYSHDGSRSSQDRRVTIWSLYSFERLLSISLGRPSAFNDSELDVSLPDNDFLRYMAPLGRISMKSSNLIYGLHNSSVLTIWESAKAIDEELAQYQADLPPNLRFEDFGKPGVVLHSDAFAIGCHFYMFKTLTYRPFLLIDGLIRKEERLHAAQGLMSPPQSAERAFLPEACRRAVDAGRGLLLLLARSYSSNAMLAKMRFNSMFLQNACAILLFDILRDPSSTSEVTTNFEIINVALECYRLMKSDIGVESGLAMIEQVQARAKEAFQAANVKTPFPKELSESPVDYFSRRQPVDINDRIPPPQPQVPETSAQGGNGNVRHFSAQSVDSLESTLPDDAVAENNGALSLDNLQFWDHWDEGFDWLKSGFMLPTENKPLDSL